MEQPGPVGESHARETIARVHHEEWARVVAALARRFGDLDVAEEAAAEAFATAVARWPAEGVPPNPAGWLTTTAQRKAIDRLRRERRRADKHREAQMVYDDDPAEPLGAIDDPRLRLIFTCCHPALAPEARVALTLRLVGGPALDGDRERLDRHLLGDVQVAEAPRQRCHHPGPLLAVDPGDRLGDDGHRLPKGRTSTLPRQAFDPSAASLSATSRSGASMIQKPPRYSFDSR